jgi:hypothetical protein
MIAIWYDTRDYWPLPVCEVELSNGERLEAIYVCGGWEKKDTGEAVYPVHFRPLRMAIYNHPELKLQS